MVEIVATGRCTAPPPDSTRTKRTRRWQRTNTYSGIALATAMRRERDPVMNAAGMTAMFKDVGPRPKMCRWIEGEPRGAATVFCGEPRDPDSDYGGCYCATHRDRARGKPAPVVVRHRYGPGERVR
jgi:hypothetical protein